MTEDSTNAIIESINSINERFDLFEMSFNKKIDSLDLSLNKRIDSLEVTFNKRIDSLEDTMNDRFILLEAKFINRLEKEIGNLAEATAKGFAEQEQKFCNLENKMNLGISMVDHKVSSLQAFYASKSAYRFA